MRTTEGKEKLITLIREDRCSAIMHLGTTGPREHELHPEPQFCSILDKEGLLLVVPGAHQIGHSDDQYQFLSTWNAPWALVRPADKHVYKINSLNPRTNLAPFLVLKPTDK